ncbi:MAG TPA: MFS transporter [Dermatophilaceae bacterium]|nr:MFS transporter [Dermatophilaceae bacterium]
MTKTRFICVLAGMWWVFLSVGILIPLLPLYVNRTLVADSSVVGVTVLIYAVAGVLARPLAAAYLRRHEPWTFMLAMALAGAFALAATPIVHEVGWMYWLRFVGGFTVGAFYTAAATGLVRDTPPQRLGSALSYFSVPLFLGVAIGPVVGDWLTSAVGHDWSWVASGLCMLMAVPFCLVGGRQPRRATPVGDVVVSGTPFGTPFGTHVPAMTRSEIWRTVAHPAAGVPAVVLALIVAGWASFQAYVPLYGPALGLPATGTVFLTYSAVVIVIRVGGARLFDRLPLVEIVLWGAVANVIGLVTVWLWADVAALYVAAVLMAVAIGLSYTTLLRIALARVPAHEEGAVVGAYSVSYDIGAGLGAAGMGVLVTWTASYSTAFLGGAASGAVSILLILQHLWPKRATYRVQRAEV